MKVKGLCDELSQISSTKEKQQWLVDNQCDELDEVFKFLCDPSIVTGIDKKKLKVKVEPCDGFDSLSNLFNYLKAHNTGTNKDVSVVRYTIENLSQDNTNVKQWLEKVVTKTLKLGVNVKTLNAAYGKDYIYVHEVQLGSPRDKLRLKDGEYFWLTQKLNGVRATYVDGKLISRQGKVFSGLDHITNELRQYDAVFDGELIRKNVDNVSDNENFRIGTGILNSDNDDKSCIEFVVFDYLTPNEYKNKQGVLTYRARRECMDMLSADSLENVRFVKPIYYGNDKNIIDTLLNYADKKGWEGLMLNKNAPYDFKRTTNLIKIKTFHFSDLKIVNVLEGDGKYSGTLGALQVEYKGNVVNVGSGFSDEQRDEYWKDKDNLIGKIVEVKYKEESTDKKTGLKSLQFPVFSRMRFDKNECSYE